MENQILKNLEHDNVIKLTEQVEILKGQVVSKTLAQNEAVGITLFAFDKGEEISSHKSTGDAMVTVLSGTALITVGDREHTVNENETIVMPANIPHAVFAREAFKMILVVVFPQK